MHKLDFTYEELWRSRMLASIGNALFAANAPGEAYSNSWDGITNSLPNGQGDNAAITFHSEFVVGAFYCHESERLTEYKDALEYFQDAPEQVKEIAKEETLQFLLGDASYFHSNCERMTGDFPVITTAFWGTREGLFSLDTQEELIENGGFDIENELIAIGSDEGIAEWAEEECGFTKEQIDLLMSLYHRKIVKPFGVIVLTEKEIQVIACEDEEGMIESKDLFEQIGIIFNSSLNDNEENNQIEEKENHSTSEGVEIQYDREEFFGKWDVLNSSAHLKAYIADENERYYDNETLIIFDTIKKSKVGILSIDPNLDGIIMHYLDSKYAITVDDVTYMIIIYGNEYYQDGEFNADRRFVW